MVEKPAYVSSDRVRIKLEVRKKNHGDAEMFAKIMSYDDNDNKTVLRSLVELHTETEVKNL